VNTSNLEGICVAVTRPRAQARDLVELLEGLGAEVLEIPTIRIKSLLPSARLEAALGRWSAYTGLLLTSANAVDIFVPAAVRRLGGVDALNTVFVAVVGPATARRCREHGLRVDLIPEKAQGEGLVEALAAVGRVSGERFLFPRARIARDVLPQALRRGGAEVDILPVYETRPTPLTPDQRAALSSRPPHAVTFTSGSTVDAFFEALGPDKARALLSASVAVSIGPITSKALRDQGVTALTEAAEATNEGLVAAIRDRFS
jgi:uroporphyrinogen III methyltransferase / synthase